MAERAQVLGRYVLGCFLSGLGGLFASCQFAAVTLGKSLEESWANCSSSSGVIPANASSGGGDNSNTTRGTKCLVKGCSELCDLPICKLHYSSLVCGKSSKLELQDGYGEATYDKVAGKTVYPKSVPARLLERIQRKRRDPKKGDSQRRR